MAKLLTYNNILDPLARTTKEVEATTSTELLETLNVNTTLYEVVIARNQIIEADPFTIEENDIIAISLVPRGGGGGKNLIATVAMIAVVIAAPYAAGAAMGYGLGSYATISAGMAIGGFTGATIVGLNIAMVVGGGLLINSMMPQPAAPDLGDLARNIETSNTYSWNTQGNQLAYGDPVPKLYGKMRVSPPQISQYVTTVDNDQYLHVLYAVADGVTNIDTDTIKINGEYISTYQDVVAYTRDGRNDQSIIGLFDDVHYDVPVNRPLTDTNYITVTTTGNSVSGLKVGIVAPQGLWYANDSGGLSTVTVKIIAEYYYEGQWRPITHSEHSDITGYWIKAGRNRYLKYRTKEEAFNALADSQDYGYIASASTLPSTTTPYTERRRVSDGYAGTYKTNLTIYADSTNYTATYSELAGNEQTAIRASYEVTGLPAGQYQVRAKLYEEAPSGSRYGSTVVFEYLEETVTDDFTYPNTALLALSIKATDQLSGSAPKVSVIASNELDNPADVCIDILKVSGETLSPQEVSSFAEWGSYCEEANLSCNIYFDKMYTVRKALDLVGVLGRGNVTQFGSKWGVIIDKPDLLPVQGFLFTMGNITQGSFNEQFLPLLDRANKIEVTYYDKNLDYEAQTVEVTNATYDTVDSATTSAVQMIGCTDRDMAIRYAKLRLNMNRYLTITQEFEVDTEAIVCRVGDIIKVSHDVPGIGTASGRIVNYNSVDNTITLDKIVALDETSQYFIEFRVSATDEVLVIDVQGGTNSDIVTLNTVPETAPSQYDIYTIGPINQTSKLMRVVSIVQSSTQHSKITCLEYVDEVYADNAVIEPHTESSFLLTGFSLSETITYVGTTSVSSINASWRGAALSYNVYVDGELYDTVYTSYCDIKGVTAPGTHSIKITDTFNNKVEGNITLLGRFYPPELPTNFTVQQYEQVLRFRWTKSVAKDVVKYEIRSGASWDSAFPIGIVGNVDTFEWSPDMNETYRFMIKAVDASGVYSDDYQFVTIDTKQIDNYLNIIVNYDGLDTDAPPCGTTTGLWFIVGRGYIPFYSIEYDDIKTTTYDDMPTQTYDEEATFESCPVDTYKVGVTKIRIFASYTSITQGATYLTYPERTYLTFPNDTYQTITAEAGLKFYYCLSDDDSTYTDWVEYTGIIDETFRYIKFKYTFTGVKTSTIASITDFKSILDVPDIDYTIRTHQVTNSETINYADYGLDFYSAPLVSPVSRDGISLPVIKNVTATSFDIEAYDVNGDLTTAIFDIRLQGY